MSGAEIKQKQEAIDSYANKIIDSCKAAAFVSLLLISTLLGYEAFNV